jgi:DNA mismatch repair protein PMS2
MQELPPLVSRINPLGSIYSESQPEEVRFRDHGLKSIEVVDNGFGISPENYDTVGENIQLSPVCVRLRVSPLTGLKHYTSKLSSFEELTTVSTFGFRGEAISSLCALSDSVTITTATISEAPMGTVIELDRSGKVRSRTTKVARQVGMLVHSQRNRT